VHERHKPIASTERLAVHVNGGIEVEVTIVGPIQLAADQ